MNFENLEIQIEEKLFDFLLQNKFKKDIEEARKYFNSNFGEVMVNDKLIIDFNAWLIYDYKMKDGKSFIEKYYEFMKNQLTKEEAEWIQKRIESYLSLYELKKIEGNEGLLKDLFTKKEYWINLDQIEDMKNKELILARRMEISKQYKLIGDTIYIPEIFKNTIDRNMITQYEDFKEKNKYGTWEEFLRSNSLLLEKYIEIILDVTQETEDEEAYNVWQSVYIMNDIKEVKKRLLKHEYVQLDFEEDGSYYFKIFEEDTLLAEMVLKNNRIELECTSKIDRDHTKKLIESILGECIKHYKDEIISIDDII